MSFCQDERNGFLFLGNGYYQTEAYYMGYKNKNIKYFLLL